MLPRHFNSELQVHILSDIQTLFFVLKSGDKAELLSLPQPGVEQSCHLTSPSSPHPSRVGSCFSRPECILQTGAYAGLSTVETHLRAARETWAVSCRLRGRTGGRDSVARTSLLSRGSPAGPKAPRPRAALSRLSARRGRERAGTGAAGPRRRRPQDPHAPQQLHPAFKTEPCFKLLLNH